MTPSSLNGCDANLLKLSVVNLGTVYMISRVSSLLKEHREKEDAVLHQTAGAATWPTTHLGWITSYRMVWASLWHPSAGVLVALMTFAVSCGSGKRIRLRETKKAPCRRGSTIHALRLVSRLPRNSSSGGGRALWALQQVLFTNFWRASNVINEYLRQQSKV